MKRYGVTPNLLVVPPQLSLYMALAPEEKIKFVKIPKPQQSSTRLQVP